MAVLDNGIPRRYDIELGTDSPVPLAPLIERLAHWRAESGATIDMHPCDLTDDAALTRVVEHAGPDTIVHLGEQRSTPYSMIDQDHAVHTQVSNVTGALNLFWNTPSRREHVRTDPSMAVLAVRP